jgi:membrane protease YdiL (CAAX protease family)
MQSKDKTKNTWLYFSLWVFCLIGAVSVIPYLYLAGGIPASAPLWKVFLLAMGQASILFGLACYLSSQLVPRTDLQPFASDNFLKRIVYPGVISGILVGFIIYFLDRIFKHSLLSTLHPPYWAGALASIYGGVNEEVLLRLFLFTFIYFLFGKLFKFNSQRRIYFLWVTNVIVAILFGIGHLPLAFKLTTPSFVEFFRIILLNGIAGIVFGWLYWAKGLWSAMTAHFVTDLMIHVFLILLFS